MTVTVGTVALGLLLAAPAIADDDSDNLLELSQDGVHFTSGQIQLFNHSSGYVPGETRPGTVWIRNASRENTSFSLAVSNTNQGRASELPRYLELSATTATHGSGTTTLPGPGLCTPVVEGWTLPAGEALQLDLNLTLLRQAPNATRNQQSSFDLLFLLQGIDGGEAVAPCADSGALPATGASMSRAPLTTGPAAVEAAAGTALAALPPQQPLPGIRGPWGTVPQSNVVPIERSPWPWLFVLGAGAYMVTSFRRRRRTQ